MNWQKNRTYRKRKEADGSAIYIINIDGKDAVVSEEVYAVYSGYERKLEYVEKDLKRDRVLQDKDGKALLDEFGLPAVLPEREVSLERLITAGWDVADEALTPEESVLRFMEARELHAALTRLARSDHALIYALYFGRDGSGMSEREYAGLSGIPQKTINDRKARILTKLRKLLAD